MMSKEKIKKKYENTIRDFKEELKKNKNYALGLLEIDYKWIVIIVDVTKNVNRIIRESEETMDAVEVASTIISLIREE